MFVFILVDLPSPVLSAKVARSEINQHPNTAAAAMDASTQSESNSTRSKKVSSYFKKAP